MRRPSNPTGRPPVPLAVAWCIALGAILAPAARADAAPGDSGERMLYTRDGAAEPATIVSAAEGQFVFQLEGEQQAVASGQIDYWGSLPKRRGGPRLILADGSTLAGSIERITEDEVEIESEVFGTVGLPRVAVAAIVFQRGPGSPLQRSRQLDRLLYQTGGQRLALRSSDSLAGRIEQLDSGWLTVRVGGQGNRLAASDVWCAVFQPPAQGRSSTGQGRTWIGLRDGSLLREVDMSLGEGGLVVASAGGWTLKSRPGLRPVEEQWVCYVRGAVPAGQSLVGLDGLSYRQVSLLDLSWPMEANRNVLGGPLQVQGRIYPVGLGMHSAARVTLDVPAGAREFAAEVALDDQAEDLGMVAFRVFTYSPEGGWVEAFGSGTVQSGSPPRPVRVSLEGATRLALAVDPADGWDARDYANWLEPRFRY